MDEVSEHSSIWNDNGTLLSTPPTPLLLFFVGVFYFFISYIYIHILLWCKYILYFLNYSVVYNCYAYFHWTLLMFCFSFESEMLLLFVIMIPHFGLCCEHFSQLIKAKAINSLHWVWGVHNSPQIYVQQIVRLISFELVPSSSTSLR